MRHCIYVPWWCSIFHLECSPSHTAQVGGWGKKTNYPKLFFAESQLATAPTNSSVVIWDINKRTKSKLGRPSAVGWASLSHCYIPIPLQLSIWHKDFLPSPCVWRLPPAGCKQAELPPPRAQLPSQWISGLLHVHICESKCMYMYVCAYVKLYWESWDNNSWCK